jgi:hypothetical protein
MKLRGLVAAGLVSILVVAVASCGRYGKPLRTAPESPAQPQQDAQSAEKR